MISTPFARQSPTAPPGPVEDNYRADDDDLRPRIAALEADVRALCGDRSWLVSVLADLAIDMNRLKGTAA